jgi:hypothetical protein
VLTDRTRPGAATHSLFSSKLSSVQCFPLGNPSGSAGRLTFVFHDLCATQAAPAVLYVVVRAKCARWTRIIIPNSFNMLHHRRAPPDLQSLNTAKQEIPRFLITETGQESSQITKPVFLLVISKYGGESEIRLPPSSASADEYYTSVIVACVCDKRIRS